MERYKVILAETAERDLVEILGYIGSVLHEPKTAERIYFSLKAQIQSLSEMPLRYSAVREEPYRTMGVRRMPAENYSVFYTVDAVGKSVAVFRILYGRREWENLL